MNFWMGKAGGVTLMGTCVEGVPAQSTCSSCVLSGPGSSAEGLGGRPPPLQTKGRWLRDCLQNGCVVCQLQAGVRQLLQRCWAVCSEGRSRVQVSKWRPPSTGREPRGSSFSAFPCPDPGRAGRGAASPYAESQARHPRESDLFCSTSSHQPSAFPASFILNRNSPLKIVRLEANKQQRRRKRGMSRTTVLRRSKSRKK